MKKEELVMRSYENEEEMAENLIYRCFSVVVTNLRRDFLLRKEFKRTCIRNLFVIERVRENDM